MTTQNREDTEAFIEEVIGDNRLRIEHDYGGGFVKLRTSEAEKRQAIQDIRSSEDIVIELLRNSRDAGARHIFIATCIEGNLRKISVIDDGGGVPDRLQGTIFEPRVTSKLDSGHLDRWGWHGRGMALFSIAQNTVSSSISYSLPDGGTAIEIISDLNRLSEKKDQSTQPSIQIDDRKLALKGPKNIVRTIWEFTLENKGDIQVYLGSPAEIAATIYAFGMAALSPKIRALSQPTDASNIIMTLGLSSDASVLSESAKRLGISISERTAHRIIQGELSPLSSVNDLIDKAISARYDEQIPNSKKTPSSKAKRNTSLKISRSDKERFLKDVMQAFGHIARAYYLEKDVDPQLTIKGDNVVISIPIVEE